MDISASIRKLTILFVVLFIGLSGGLVYWQVAVAPTLTASAHNSRKCLTQNIPVRGRILDRNGVVLAESKPDPSNNCGGYTRYYTDPGLAGLIGYYVPGDLYPARGIEGLYSDYLNGTKGATALNNTINQLVHTRQVGDDIYLTIDERIQKIVEKEYRDYTPDPAGTLATDYGYQTFSTNRGSVVVTDPKTGEILAMYSSPSYDPNELVKSLQKGQLSYYNQLEKDPDQPLIFRPTQGLYVPGSVFKTLTMLAALDSGTTTLGQEWDKQNAYEPWHVAATADSPATTITGDNLGYGYPDYFVKRFPVSTAFGFANSDNIMFAHIGDALGEDKWLDYAKKVYLDQDVPTELSVVQSSVMQSGGKLDRATYLNDAYGQGVDNVTPLQMSLIDNAVANNGVLMRPQIFTKITDEKGNPIETYSPQQLSTVASADAAYNTRKAMMGVTVCGSAWHVNENNVPATTIIGKTGTAQLGGDQHPHGWMITQAPFDLNNSSSVPALTIVAMRENGGEGAYTIGPAIWRMYNDIFSQNLVKTSMPARVTTSYCTPNGLWQSNS